MMIPELAWYEINKRWRHLPYLNYPSQHTDFHQEGSQSWQFWPRPMLRKIKLKNEKRILPNKWIIRPCIYFDELPMVRPSAWIGGVYNDVISISVGDTSPGSSSLFGCDRIGVTIRMSLYLPLWHISKIRQGVEQRPNWLPSETDSTPQKWLQSADHHIPQRGRNCVYLHRKNESGMSHPL